MINRCLLVLLPYDFLRQGLFAGIGRAMIVCLKQLGIAMQKVISHVEHDKIASHVYKYSMHDSI
jgi:hypothetical protein